MTPEIFVNWSNQAFPWMLEKTMRIYESVQPDDPDMLREVKNRVFSTLVSDIIATAHESNRGDFVGAWDIRAVVANTPQMSQVFGLAPGPVVLPIVVTMGPETFQHNVSLQKLAGLIIGAATVGQVLNITYMQQPITPESFIGSTDDTRIRRFQVTDPSKGVDAYIINIGNGTFTCGDPEIMAGVLTAFQWLNVPYQQVLTNFKMINADGTSQDLAIQF
jgi:hypothetical protein